MHLGLITCGDNSFLDPHPGQTTSALDCKHAVNNKNRPISVSMFILLRKSTQISICERYCCTWPCYVDLAYEDTLRQRHACPHIEMFAQWTNGEKQIIPIPTMTSSGPDVDGSLK